MAALSPSFSRALISGESRVMIICLMPSLSRLHAKLQSKHTRLDHFPNLFSKEKSKKMNHLLNRLDFMLAVFYPMLMAVSILSPVRTQILIPACANLSMHCGT